MLYTIHHLLAALAVAILTTSTLCTLTVPIADAQQILNSQDVMIKHEKGGKVPGENPATYCSDPSTDIYKIMHLHFYPVNPRL